MTARGVLCSAMLCRRVVQSATARTHERVAQTIPSYARTQQQQRESGRKQTASERIMKDHAWCVTGAWRALNIPVTAPPEKTPRFP